MLTLDNISAGYGDCRVLTDIDLHADSGCTVVLGPNGSGKTTLFRIGAGILEPTSGTVSIHGTDPFDDPEIKREIGYLPHTPSLHPGLSVRENLTVWGRLYNVDETYLEKRIASLSSSLDFADLLSEESSALSRGQAQRVSIARSLLHEPSLLFFDEPTSGLDPGATATLVNLVQDLASSQRLLLYATHNLDEATEVADAIVVLRGGTVAAAGTRDEIAAQYEGSRTVEIQPNSETVETELREMGYDPIERGESLQIEVDSETTVMSVLQTLDSRGVDVSDIDTDRNALENLYRTVEEGDVDA